MTTGIQKPSARLYRKFMGFIALSIFFATSSLAQSSKTLPPAILDLVPSGKELVSQLFTYSPVMAGADFNAKRDIDIGRTAEFSLKIMLFDNSSPTWRMKEPAYRKRMEDKIAYKRKKLASESSNFGMFTADPVVETKYPWGSGLTQRLLNHPPQAKECITYDCAYFGMIGGVVFELSVSGLPDSPNDGNDWAQ